MGAAQSSTFTSENSTHDNTKKTAGEYNMKTCYYELLGVERTATDAELKKAYRKQALLWHPDKNYDKVEEATRIFALIQHAYEVLSDPHERAWYDGHRDEILREDSDYVGDTNGRGYSTLSGHTPESLMRFFNPDCYTGFNDDSRGFYVVYRELFAQLAKEETEAHNPDFEESDNTAARLDWLASCSFGDSHTPFVDENRPEHSMKVFYNEWSNFATRKSFRWLDKWRLSDAPNRFVKRHMEKENKKNRETGRRAYNDAVRNLVAFVRKRDPRYKQFQQEQEILRKEREEAQKAKLAAERAERLQRLEDYEAPAWAKIEEHDAVLDELDDVWEEEEIQWECQACNKRFKNERQWKNHESSKKHHEIVEILRRELLADDGVEEEPSDDATTTSLTDSETGELKAETEVQVDSDEDKPISENEDEEEMEIVTFSIRSKKAQKKAAAKRRAGRGAAWTTEANLLASDALSSNELADLLAASQIGLDTKTNSTEGDEPNEDFQDFSDEQVDSPSQWNTSASQKRERRSGRGRRRAKSGRNTGSKPETTALANDQVNNTTIELDDENGKAPDSTKKKSNRRAAATLANTGTLQFTCAVCHAKFETRNAMFKHIAATGHAIPLNVRNSETQTKKNSKKKKGSRT